MISAWSPRGKEQRESSQLKLPATRERNSRLTLLDRLDEVLSSGDASSRKSVDDSMDVLDLDLAVVLLVSDGFDGEATRSIRESRPFGVLLGRGRDFPVPVVAVGSKEKVGSAKEEERENAERLRAYVRVQGALP